MTGYLLLEQNNGTRTSVLEGIADRAVKAIKESPTVAMAVATIRTGKRLVGLWLLCWGILYISKEAMRSIAGLGGLSIFAGAALLGINTTRPPRA